MKAIIINASEEYNTISVITVSNDGNVRVNDNIAKKLDETDFNFFNDEAATKYLKNAKFFDNYNKIYLVVDGIISVLK